MSGFRDGSGAEPLRDAERVGDLVLGTSWWFPTDLKYIEEKRASMARKRNHGRIQAHDESALPCLQDDDDDSQDSKRQRCSLPELPEEIWQHIHSLMPMRDAARAACVSHAFQRSWRCHPNLTFTKETICSKENLRHWTGDANDKRDITEYNNTIDRILANHMDTGVKASVLEFYGPYEAESYDRLSNWLEIAVTPGIEELTLSLLPSKSKFNFPCSLLSDRRGNMIRYLSLRNCVLRPGVNLGLRCLKELDLSGARITGDELGRLLSSSFALEKLVLTSCYDIIRLEIPCLLQRLSYVEVFACLSLQVIENKAPNISCFKFAGDAVQISLGESVQVKNLKLDGRRVISTAIDKLPTSVPNLETLTLHSHSERVDARVIPSKFLHLKVLSICFRNWTLGREYDFLSLVSFLDASPSLETFVLSVSVEWKYDLVVGAPSSLRQMPEHHHDRLKDVKITGFCPQKSLVELTRHILESAKSLRCLKLDTIDDNRRSCNKSDMECSFLGKEDIRNVRKSFMAIRKYIKRKVPSTVQLDVLMPCSCCHDLSNVWGLCQ
ncbi:unnamed protein product [Alopecurus aequalis]